MALDFGFFSDAGLTQPLASLSVPQASDGSAAAVDSVIYFGALNAGLRVQANSDPGVDPVYVAVTDALPAAGIPATSVKLAATAEGLATALAGEPLALGTEVLSTPAAAVPVHVRIQTPAVAVGSYTDLSLTMPELLQDAP